MKKIVYFLFERIALFEVIFRLSYYNFSWIRKYAKKPSNKTISIEKDTKLFDTIIDKIKACGIKKGDFLIVHSSMDGLAKTDASPEMFIDALLEIVGDEGTLVFPAFPMEKKMKRAKCENSDDEILIYDPKKTPSWTGLMPNIFCRYPSVIRSEFPNNSLAAKGKHAKDMMKDNLLGDLPHGKNSAWAYCVKHNAKILFLGLPSFHSNTVTHVAEDLMDASWPIKDWYEKKKYIVITSKGEQEIIIRERKQFWAQYIAEHYLSHLLKANALLVETNVEDVCLGFIENSNKLTEFLIHRAESGKISYIIPRKYWKQNENLGVKKCKK